MIAARDNIKPEVSGNALGQAKSPRVSVVIPVYNVERYLRECLDSVVNQTLHDIEIICVDDGSTDGSAAILAEYASKDKRIRIISQPNKGPSAARNVGMSNANGEYIYFLDSDDWIEANALEHLIRIADEQFIDQVIFSAHAFCDKEYQGEDAQKNLAVKERYYSVAPQIAQKPMTGIDLMRSMLDNHAFFVPVTLRLFRLSALRKANITFPEGCLHEDEYFTPVSLVNANKALTITEKLYHRRLRANSIVTSGDLLAKRLRGYLTAGRLLKAYAESHCADGSEGKRLLMTRSNAMRTVARNFSEGISPEDLPDDCKNALISIYKEDRIVRIEAEKTAIRKMNDAINREKNAIVKLTESQKQRRELFSKLQEAQRARGELFAKLQESQKSRGELFTKLQESQKARSELFTKLQESQKSRGELFTKLQESQRVRGELFTKLQESQKVRGELFTKLQESQKVRGELFTKLQESQKARGELFTRLQKQLQDKTTGRLIPQNRHTSDKSVESGL